MMLRVAPSENSQIGDRVMGTAGTPDIRLFQIGNNGDISLSQAMSFLAGPERARAQRFRFQKDHDRFVRARGLLRKTLADHLDIAPKSVEFATTGNGKPVLVDQTPHFNLSHSGDLAVIALSYDHPVGVDLEVASRSIRPLELAETCFTESERRALEKGDLQQQRFYAFWTAKEALMKLTGEGLSLSPKHISLRLDEDGWPVGYDAIEGAAAKLRFVDLGIQNTTCCLAFPARPTEKPN